MQVGEFMPQTATNYPNWMLIGGMLIIIGLGILTWFWWQERDIDSDDHDPDPPNHRLPIK